MTGSLRMHDISVSEKSGRLAAAWRFSLLNRWTRNRSVGAKNAAVTRLWSDDRVAFFTLIKPLTSIGGHRLGFGVPALRTGQHRRQEHLGQGLTPVIVDGKPASFVARVRASNEVWVSSYTTVVSLLSKLDFTSTTPASFVSAFLTVIGQVAQDMPGTERVAVCCAAHANGLRTNPAAIRMRFTVRPFINRTSVRSAGMPSRWLEATPRHRTAVCRCG